MKTTKKEKLRGVAAILVVIGGATSAIGGAAVWMPYIVSSWVTYGFVPPLLGFTGFILGILVVLGGIFIIRDRSVVGGNLAIWCGIAGIFGGGVIAALQTLTRFFPGLVAAVLGLTLTILCPVLGGALGLMSKRNRNEPKQ